MNQAILLIALLLLVIATTCTSVSAQDGNTTLAVLPIHEALGGAEVTYDPATGKGVLSLLPPTSLVLLADRPERVVTPPQAIDTDRMTIVNVVRPMPIRMMRGKSN